MAALNDDKYVPHVTFMYVGASNKITFVDAELDILKTGESSLGYTVEYSGKTRRYSQRNFEDKNDELLGIKFAVGRALEALGKDIQKNAWGTVIHKDNMKRQAIDNMKKQAEKGKRKVKK
jgi:hypothetical protein